MDNTTITVNSTSDPILVPAGEFRIFGNVATTLSTDEVVLNDIVLFPNPANTHFKINKRTTDVVDYNLLGKEVAKFSGNFAENYEFTIDQLQTGMYMVKANGEEGTIIKRLIKE